MSNQILKKIFIGDKYLIAFVFVFVLASILSGFSASSNIEYAAQTGTVWGQFGKQIAFLVIGIAILLSMQLVNYKYFGGIATISLVPVIILLVWTIFQGTTIEGANASRWLKLPGIPLSIQTSTLASVVLMTYVARFLAINKDKEITLKSAAGLFIPVFFIIGLIFPANGSTAVILFSMVMILLFIGNFPMKYLLSIALFILVAGGLFIFVALKYSDSFGSNTRVHTWKNRIERFQNPSENSLDSWQETNAKAAIVEGGYFGKGPGKSAIKHTLPQASSDFIFAVIIEEYGSLTGGLIIIFLYLLILYRIAVIATKIKSYFGTLLVFASGLPIIFQAMINMGVAVGLFPTTGQPLPMISFGGTSLWITCVSLGMILSVSRQIKTEEELEKSNKDESYIQEIA